MSIRPQSHDNYASSSGTHPPRPRTALERRLTTLRWTAAVVLAGFLLNAGLSVWLVSSIADSFTVSLGVLAAMGIFIVGFVMYAETFKLKATGARALLPGEYPWLKPMVGELAGSVGLRCPEVLISDQGEMNAYTTGVGDRSKVVFMRGLLENLSTDEVRAVAAHELGHVVNKDISLGVWSWAVSSWVAFVTVVGMALAGLIFAVSHWLSDQGERDGDAAGMGMMFAGILFIVIAFLMRIMIRAWGMISRLTETAISRQREHLADATAVAITRDPETLSRALAKITLNPHFTRGASAVGRFCIMSPSLVNGFWEELTDSHPSPESRIKALTELSTEELPVIDAEWRGVGGEAWVLPAGAIGVLVLLAMVIPSL